MRRPDEVLSRLDLLESAWDQAYDNRSNIVDAYIRRLGRRSIDPSAPQTLQTVRGSGYRLCGNRAC